MNTFELLNEAGKMVDRLMAQEGEITDEDCQAIEEWADDTGDKLNALRAVYRRLDSEREVWAHEEGRIKDAKIRATKGIERVKHLASELLEAREALGEPTNVKGVAHLRRTTVLGAPENVLDWPVDFLIQPSPKPDRKKALAALKAGEDLPDGFSLQSRASTVFK